MGRAGRAMVNQSLADPQITFPPLLFVCTKRQSNRKEKKRKGKKKR
jgi:hypothetical protein